MSEETTLAKVAADSGAVGNQQTLKALVASRATALAAYAPDTCKVTPERVLKLLATAASRNPQLLQCTKESVWLAVTKAVELGFEPCSAMGHAHLVPFYNSDAKRYECTLIVGYQGLLDLVRRSGKVRNVYSEIVYSNDSYRVELGTSYKMEHAPRLDGDRGEPLFAYSVAIFNDGTVDFMTMTREQIEKRMRASRAGYNRETGKAKGVWATWEAEMWQKTVLRSHCKRLPMSINEIERLTDAESAPTVGEFSDVMAAEASVSDAPETPANVAALEAKTRAVAAEVAKPKKPGRPTTKAEASVEAQAPIVPPPADDAIAVEASVAGPTQAEEVDVVEALVAAMNSEPEEEVDLSYWSKFEPRLQGKATVAEFAAHCEAKAIKSGDLISLEAARIGTGKIICGDITR